MQQKYYTIAFVDKTNNGTFSNAKIATGTESIASNNKTSDKSVFETVSEKVGNKLVGTMLSSTSSVVGFNLTPTYNLGKALLTGTGGGAIASAGIAIASQIVSLVWNSISNKIAQLKQEAAEANERDNTLILSGSLDISGYTITKGKWGRDEYVYNRS